MLWDPVVGAQEAFTEQVKRQEAKLGAHSGEWVQSTSDFLKQIGFREYARYLSFHFPFTHERSLLEHLRAAPWKFDQRFFKASLPCFCCLYKT
jgi:cryptochrome 1